MTKRSSSQNISEDTFFSVIGHGSLSRVTCIGERMTEQSPEPEVDAQRAYEAGAAVLLKRAKRVLADRDDSLTLLAGAADRWFQVTPWADLPDRDREFWSIIAGLLNTAGLGVRGIGGVLDIVRESAADARTEREALFAKCGKVWQQ